MQQPPPIEQRYSHQIQQPKGQIVDPRGWNIPAVLAAGMTIMAAGAVAFYFNSVTEFNDKIEASENRTNKKIDKVVGSITDLKTMLAELAAVGKKVVGKTPEGYHRRDCQDLVSRLETEIAREISAVTYKPENFPANTAILRALHRVDCYDLPGFKSRVASSWNTIVKKGN